MRWEPKNAKSVEGEISFFNETKLSNCFRQGCKRSFSVMNRIRSVLRKRLTQRMLNYLMTINTEGHFLKDFKLNVAIKIFGEVKKQRLKKFKMPQRLHEGQFFNKEEDLEAAIKEYQERNYVHPTRRHHRSSSPESVTFCDSDLEDQFLGRRLYNSVPVSTNYKGMNLQEVVKRLHSIASPSLAEKWDNVGLLVEPTPPHLVNNIMLTNDLTPPVLDEALGKGANMIISYHPPIFTPLKRLTAKNWKESLIVKCIENHVAVYSPHTSYDCAQGGINDWLISCFDTQEKKPIESHSEIIGPYTRQICALVSLEAISDIRTNLTALSDINMSTSPVVNDAETDTKIDVCIYCNTGNLQNIISVFYTFQESVTRLTCVELSKLPKPGYGMGRKATLTKPIALEEAVEKVKFHLGLDKVRLAAAPGSPSVSSVAVCAGSGGSLLKDVSASLFVTGEMSHHDVLHAMYSGTSVIVCDHSNTERGYLSLLKDKLQSLFDNNINIFISTMDLEPLKIV